MDMLVRQGLIPWIGGLGTCFWEGMGSAQLVCFLGCVHSIHGENSLGGGLIAWMGQLGTGAFLGGCGISAVGLFRRRGHRIHGVDSLGA